MFHIYRLKLSSLQPGTQDPPDNADGWKVYGYCERDDKNSLILLTRIINWTQRDAKAVKDGILRLLQKAPVGKPIEQLYDRTQCHEAFTFKLGQKEHKVWRLWPSGVVRIYFCYGSEKKIIIAWALAKREDKLTNAEKKELKDLFSDFFTAQEANQIKCVDD